MTPNQLHEMLATCLRVRADATIEPSARRRVSRDTSIFERIPSAVVAPRDTADVAAVVRCVHGKRAAGENISITARSAGTDMTGGPLTSSIVMSFTEHVNHIGPVEHDEITVEPGAYYRDLERATLAWGLLLPSYPASKDICAVGGMIANNAGGERTLKYGKTERYIRSLDVVLSDGTKAVLRPLSREELEEKKKRAGLEGEIYRRMERLLTDHASAIEEARPKVPKNSAGYALWNVIDRKRGMFDLTQLIVGSQGTLALVTGARLALVRPKEHRAMLIVFLQDLNAVPEIVRRVLGYGPESFESYDDHTLKLAVRFFPHMLRQMGLIRAASLGLSFIPEVWMAATGGVPRLILMAEFAEDTKEEAVAKCREARQALADLPVSTRIASSSVSARKYWIVRRESFALLRKNLSGLYAAPFIDDFVVSPDFYPEFLPRLTALLEHHHLIYTIAGHVGNGNFHIIPLMDLSDPAARAIITELAPKVYALVVEYGGSITGEHNDGIMRTPYLPMMFGEKMVALFKEVKDIFDPLGVFNPGKKIGGTVEDIERDMIKER